MTSLKPPRSSPTESQAQIVLLSKALNLHATSTTAASSCCTGLTRRSRQLDSLTSPASETSASLTLASTNLTATLTLLRDAREKFDTVADCEPSIERLNEGARELKNRNEMGAHQSRTFNVPNANDDRSILDVANTKRSSMAFGPMTVADDDTLTIAGTIQGGSYYTEQDVYAAADSMEIIRDAYAFFQQRSSWKSTPAALGGLERVHQIGVDGMCSLVGSHLTMTGPAVRKKRSIRGRRDRDDATLGDSTIATTTTFGGGGTQKASSYATETAAQTRDRLSAALQNRDLMKSVGEYEEILPLDTRTVRELRAIFECLSGDGCQLNPRRTNERTTPRKKHQVAPSKVSRTEKIGSGCFTNMVKQPLNSGYSHLDAYAAARKEVAYQSIQLFYRQLRAQRKKEYEQRLASGGQDVAQAGEMDSAARDAVRCLEHAMVIVAGEKSIYRCVISPTSSHNHDSSKIPLDYKYAVVGSYSHICAVVVDRIMDIVDLFFFKDAGIRPSSSAPSTSDDNGDGDNSTATVSIIPVRVSASAAVASLRILDGVRMLGPSLAKLCEMASDRIHGKGSSSKDGTSLAANLCIGIHRTAVKSGGKALENLAVAIRNDPLNGEMFRPADARVAAISSDVVRAIRLVSPFVNAYKSVTKRRPLPWDPKIGEAAGEMDFFIRYLIMTLLSNLQNKALNYVKDPSLVSQAKSYLFLMNNSYYVSEQLGYNYANDVLQGNNSKDREDIEGQDFKINSPWFFDQVNKMFESSMKKYLQNWEALVKHLSAVEESEIQYQNYEQKLLSLESGRLLKARFSGFNEDFENTYALHKELTVIDPKLRKRLLQDVKGTFLPQYREFYHDFSKYQFSKKNQDEYLKYPPKRVESMMADMFSTY